MIFAKRPRQDQSAQISRPKTTSDEAVTVLLLRRDRWVMYVMYVTMLRYNWSLSPEMI